MNAAVRAIVKVAAARGVRVLGVLDGYDGLVDGRFRELTRTMGGRLRSAEDIDRAGSQGGTVLGSARSSRFRDPAGRTAAARALGDCAGLIVIGGDGSLTGAHLLATEHGIATIGIAASIDNDVGCTGMALGTDTALNTIVSACDRICDTAASHRRAFVVEVMGRRSGYLAMASAVALGAEGVLLPEQGRSEDAVVEAVTRLVRDGFEGEAPKRRVLVIKAEGVEVPCTRLVRLVSDRLGDRDPPWEVRATVLGHMVRGGGPSYLDRMIGGRVGLAAVEAVLSGVSDEMVAWQPTIEGGTATADPTVRRYPLEAVLAETRALLDGTSPVTQWRMRLLHAAEGVLAI
jgi:6-phosphofructokinase 1